MTFYFMVHLHFRLALFSATRPYKNYVLALFSTTCRHMKNYVLELFSAKWVYIKYNVLAH